MAEYVVLQLSESNIELIANEITLILDLEFMKCSISDSSSTSQFSSKDLTFVIFILCSY